MADGKAIVRKHIEKIDGVSRTWFEWISRDSAMAKTLVVEVEFDKRPPVTAPLWTPQRFLAVWI
jgi:hypothetical protein